MDHRDAARVGPHPEPVAEDHRREARIVQMYRDGYSIAQTSEECGISNASVIRIRAAEKQRTTSTTSEPPLSSWGATS
ncbi:MULTISPECIES: helix-turn-helix domain-containing protein [Kocuria]|uniref:helix-turn-helix domain-containing protein n=1 Tax=Kocuria TaxID=57493 RepID=UPI000EF85BBE